VVTIGADKEDTVDTGFDLVGTAHIPSVILESVIDLAMAVAVDGWEGRPLGTLMVLGDTAVVMENRGKSPLTHSRAIPSPRRISSNPEVRNSIKNLPCSMAPLLFAKMALFWPPVALEVRRDKGI